MVVKLRPHLKIRLKERQIPSTYPVKILSKPDKKFIDTQTDHRIVVKRLTYNGRTRPMVVAYDIIGKEIQVITIHPSSSQEIKNKINKRRWIKNEKSKKQ